MCISSQRASFGPVCRVSCVFVDACLCASGNQPSLPYLKTLWAQPQEHNLNLQCIMGRGTEAIRPPSPWQLRPLLGFHLAATEPKLCGKMPPSFGKPETLVGFWAATCAFVLLYAIWSQRTTLQAIFGKLVWNSNRIWTWGCSCINLLLTGQLKDWSVLVRWNCGFEMFVGWFFVSGSQIWSIMVRHILLTPLLD